MVSLQLQQALQQVTLELQHQQTTLELAPQVQESVLQEQALNQIHSLVVDSEVLLVEWAALVAVCHQAWAWEECNQDKCHLLTR